MSHGNILYSLRAEFDRNRCWGPESRRMRRFEVSTPDRGEDTVFISGAAGSVHTSRASLLFRVSGAHLRDTRENLVQRIEALAPLRMVDYGARPSEYVERVVGWLESECAHGFLERALVNAIMMVVVDDDEVWTWSTSPQGVVSGYPADLRLQSTDLRVPVLVAMGRYGPAFVWNARLDGASSVWWVGTPFGYERIRSVVADGGVVIGLDRMSYPYGAWPSVPVPVSSLWGMEAAWMYGARGMAVAIGRVTAADLKVPAEWSIREVPLGGS